MILITFRLYANFEILNKNLNNKIIKGYENIYKIKI